jgi:hypothetical protein
MAQDKPIANTEWQLMAQALVPDEYEEERTEGIGSIYLLLGSLLSRIYQAHIEGDRDYLLRAYSFADWCARQKNQEVWNASGVSFYEGAFDRLPVEQVVPWIRLEIYEQNRDLLEAMRPELFAEIDHAFKSRAGGHDREIVELAGRTYAIVKT